MAKKKKAKSSPVRKKKAVKKKASKKRSVVKPKASKKKIAKKKVEKKTSLSKKKTSSKGVKKTVSVNKVKVKEVTEKKTRGRKRNVDQPLQVDEKLLEEKMTERDFKKPGRRKKEDYSTTETVDNSNWGTTKEDPNLVDGGRRTWGATLSGRFEDDEDF